MKRQEISTKETVSELQIYNLEVDQTETNGNSKKLLARRQSQDPLKLLPPEAPKDHEVLDQSPNLASFMFNPIQPLFPRSDSPSSVASLTYSGSLSDSGIDSSKQNSEKGESE